VLTVYRYDCLLPRRNDSRDTGTCECEGVAAFIFSGRLFPLQQSSGLCLTLALAIELEQIPFIRNKFDS
jgi:hypothetical protein